MYKPLRCLFKMLCHQTIINLRTGDATSSHLHFILLPGCSCWSCRIFLWKYGTRSSRISLRRMSTQSHWFLRLYTKKHYQFSSATSSSGSVAFPLYKRVNLQSSQDGNPLRKRKQIAGHWISYFIFQRMSPSRRLLLVFE